MKPGSVTVANEQVSIATVCRILGVEVADESRPSMKLHCPFGEIYHSDQGIDPAMRVYDESNTAYCFACSASYTPVSMYAQAMDLRWRQAATALLQRVGYRPLDPSQAWEQAQAYAPEPDRTQLAEALKTYCRRVDPRWGDRQFEEPVATVLTRCLNLLDFVCTDDDAALWLARCKAAMAATIDV